eukprot:g4575.t1
MMPFSTVLPSTRVSRLVHRQTRYSRLPRIRASEVGAPIKDPFAEKTQYKDGFVTKFFLKWFSKRMCEQLGKSCPEDIDYDTFVKISREVLKRGSPSDAQQVIKGVLSATCPPEAAERFKAWFPPVKWSAEFNAWLTTKGFLWLVGECELEETELETPQGTKEVWNSVVKIKKCRYLESSGCTGMCVNMCKIPTQRFFTEDFGLPVTMNPNFEDLSCEMIFGQMPPPILEDPAIKQPCFTQQCPIAISSTESPCPKTPKAEN